MADVDHPLWRSNHTLLGRQLVVTRRCHHPLKSAKWQSLLASDWTLVSWLKKASEDIIEHMRWNQIVELIFELVITSFSRCHQHVCLLVQLLKESVLRQWFVVVIPERESVNGSDWHVTKGSLRLGVARVFAELIFVDVIQFRAAERVCLGIDYGTELVLSSRRR